MACHGGCYGGAVMGAAPATQGAGQLPPPATGGEQKKEMKKGDGLGYVDPTRATIVVSLPAEAKLFVDNKATVSTSNVRTFASPALELGKDFEYSLRAEMVRDGQKLVTSKTVLVRAGQETRVAIDFPTASVASK
jgi:uncharacterized protein (TIGR03000 family)